MTKKISVVIVAAGSGSRFGDPRPKQYHEIGGKSLLRHCVERFMAFCPQGNLQVVIHPDHRDMYDAALGDLALPSPVAGGATRQQSVLNGLQALANCDLQPDYVLIHDAARPGISDEVIARVLAALAHHDGAIPTLPVLDTIKQCDTDGVIQTTIPRSTLHRAQTPQGFQFDKILAAHLRHEGQEMTDDASLLELNGCDVVCVAGSDANDKITQRDDMIRAHQMISDTDLNQDIFPMTREEFRTGTGFDVHRFVPGTECILCGIAVPHTARLDGHSDADVGLHTLTDALLGAIGAGDIGQHFPPTDPQWKGAASDQFVRHAVNLITQRGGRIVNADITLICERPKISPHTEKMRACVANILGIAVERVNVKATTTERLGFTGREEGIAAQAAVSIALPIVGD
ncbi:MAG: bifunctional 2-C-methyl-D-erythritol 4-phosphate cytidylyltransferase/2-C-methyl-D-erythritol 2,4-cyclodiphosphate synthase [Pseudomonadota bacterium]